jgi:hypothetical protein
MAIKLVAFFSTASVKNVSGAIAFTAIMSGTLLKYLPNSLLMEEMKEFLQLYRSDDHYRICSVLDFSYNLCIYYYRNSFPVSVPAELNEQLDHVKRDMKFSEKDSKNISAFTVYGFNILHLGTTWFKTGVLVGLPANFSYKQPSDVDKQIITVLTVTITLTDYFISFKEDFFF